MHDIRIFENEEFGKVRTLLINGAPWFVGKDVAQILQYQNGNRDVVRHVDEEEIGRASCRERVDDLV